MSITSIVVGVFVVAVLVSEMVYYRRILKARQTRNEWYPRPRQSEHLWSDDLAKMTPAQASVFADDQERLSKGRAPRGVQP